MRLVETFDLTGYLQPIQRPEDARQDACTFGPNLTIPAGQVIGIKTADKKGYIYATGNVDGTQLPVGLSMYTFKTDANGLVYYATTAVADARTGPWQTSPIWVSGIFDPADLTGMDAGAIAALFIRKLHNGFYKLP